MCIVFSVQVQETAVFQLQQWLDNPPMYERVKFFPDENLFLLISRLDYTFYM
jgi:hypothetical protein